MCLRRSEICDIADQSTQRCAQSVVLAYQQGIHMALRHYGNYKGPVASQTNPRKISHWRGTGNHKSRNFGCRRRRGSTGQVRSVIQGAISQSSRSRTQQAKPVSQAPSSSSFSSDLTPITLHLPLLSYISTLCPSYLPIPPWSPFVLSLSLLDRKPPQLPAFSHSH